MADKKVILEVEYDTDEAQKAVDELALKIGGLKETSKKYNEQVRNARKDLKKTDDQLKKEGKTREGLAKIIREGTVASAKVNDQMKAASKQRAKTIKEINGEKSAFDKLNENLEKNTKAQNKSTQALQNMPGPLGATINGLRGMTKAALAFIATPIGAVIAALGLALKALMSYFKGSEEGQNKLNKIMQVGSVIIGNLGDSFRDFGKLVLDSIMVLGAKFTKFFAKIGLGWQKLKGIFKDNTEAIEEQRDKIAEAEKILTERQDTRKKSAEELKNGIKGIIDETKKEIEIAQKLADRQAALDKLQRDFLVKRAKLQSEIAELRAKAADKENFTAEERIKLIEEAIEKENQILATDQKIAKEKFEIKKIQNSLSDSTKEDLDQQAQLEAELLNVQTQNARKRKSLNAELTTARREAATEEEKERKAREAAEQKAAEKAAKIEQEKIERRAAAIQKMAEMEQQRIEREAATFEEEKEIAIKRAEEELEMKLEQKDLLDEEIELAEAEHKARLAAIDAEYQAKVKAHREANLQQTYESMQRIVDAARGMADKRVSIVSDAFAQISTINWEEVEDNKQAFVAIANAASGLTQLITAGNEQELADLQMKKEQELALTEGNAEAQAAIEKKYANESAKIKEQQAKEEKTAAIIDATIATAIGVVKALGDPGGVAGIILAALVGVLGAVQVASIASQPTPQFKTFAKGGSIVEGPSHATGGVDIFGDNGQYFGNVQGNEAMFVMNKDATSEIAAYSALNESYGGRSFFNKPTKKFEEGGQMDNIDNVQRVVQDEFQRTPIFVRTGDIETGLTERQKVKQVGII